MGALLLCLAQPGKVFGQEPFPSAQLGRYLLPPLPGDGLTLSRPAVLEHLQGAGRVMVDYANDPLVFEAQRGDAASERFALISHQLTAHLAGALGLFDRFAVFASLPFHLALVGQELGQQPQSNHARVGDLRLGGRALLVDDAGFSAAFQLSTTASTSPDSHRAPGVAGESGVTVHSQLLGQWQAGAVSLTANLGLYLRKDKAFAGITFRDEVTYGIGAELTLLPTLSLLLEGYGTTPVSNVGAGDTSTLEALLGGRLQLPAGLSATLGGGSGLLRGYGSPDLRILAGVEWVSPKRQRAAAPPPDPDVQMPESGEAPTGETPEPLDLGPAADAVRAPSSPPVHSTKPDPLPAVAPIPHAGQGTPGQETLLPPVDPTLDADGDGLMGEHDRCPRAPGEARADGCPRYVRLLEDRIEFIEPLRFANGRAVLRGRGKAALTEVAAIIEANPRLLLQVEAHAGDVGSAEARLAQDRALLVVDLLKKQGADPTRLNGTQCGVRYPLAPVGSSWAASTNARIELRLSAGSTAPRSGCETLLTR